MESEAFDDLEKSTDALRTVKDLAAGAAGGMAQVLLGKCTALRGTTREHLMKPKSHWM
jgi:solute carrier family 25 carnitine/acylcarnitine transporter 20/29